MADQTNPWDTARVADTTTQTADAGEHRQV